MARGQLRVLAAAPEHGRPWPHRIQLPGPYLSLRGPWLTSERGITRMFRGEAGIGGTQGFAGLSQIKFCLQQEGCAGEGRERRLRVPESFALCNRRVRARFTSSSLTTELRGWSCSVRAQLPLPEPSPRSTSPEPLLSARGLKLGARL